MDPKKLATTAGPTAVAIAVFGALSAPGAVDSYVKDRIERAITERVVPLEVTTAKLEGDVARVGSDTFARMVEAVGPPINEIAARISKLEGK